MTNAMLRITAVIAMMLLIAGLLAIAARQAVGAPASFQEGIRWERVGFADMPEEIYRNFRLGAYVVVVYCDRMRGTIIYRWVGSKGADHMVAVPNGCEKAP
jgi:hypothetical protein